MLARVSAAELAATNADDSFVREPSGNSDRSVIEGDENWFAVVAQVLLAPKPGLTLHLQTDCGERNGHRYANGDVKPPGYIVRQLLRSQAGEPWLNALMDGSNAEWWHELQRDAAFGRKVRAIRD